MKMYKGAWFVVVVALLVFLGVGCGDSGGDADASRDADQAKVAGESEQQVALSGAWELFGVTERDRWISDQIGIYSPDAEMETGESRVTLNFPGRFNVTYEWDAPAQVLRPGDPLPGLRIRSEVYDGALRQPDAGIRADIRVMERRTMEAAYSAEVSMPRPGPGVFENEGAEYTSSLAGQEGQVLSAVPEGASNQTLRIDLMAAGANAFYVRYNYEWVD